MHVIVSLLNYAFDKPYKIHITPLYEIGLMIAL